MKRNRILLSLVFVFFCSSLFLFFKVQGDKDKDKQFFEFSQKNYYIFSPYIPDKIEFAGETVPIEKYYVRERLERELLNIMYTHSRTISILKKSRRFFPAIQKVLKEQSVPDDFKYLAMTESELSFVISPSNAAGIWQFLKATAIEYGLEVNSEVDERFHIEKSTLAACKYLLSAFSKFKNWTVSAASYNMGMANLPEIMKEQRSDSYYSLVLNEETSRYIYRIIAYKLVYENPRRYGFILRNKDLYMSIPVKQVEVDTSITSLYDFAASQNISYLSLKLNNQWLRSNSLKNSQKKKYIIEIPVNENYLDILKQANQPYLLLNDTISL